MVEQAGLGLIRRVLMVGLATVPLIAAPASAQESDLEKSFSTVVMIEGKLQGTTSFGAGIVVGARAGRVYIATANHVVRSGRTTATDISVQFRFLPGEKFAARLLDTRDTELDLAVLSISASDREIPRNELNFKVLGDSDALARGSDVHPLGNPRSQSWGVSINPEKVDRKKATEIAFQSSYIQPGHSGGALLDGCGDIVGLIVRDQPPNGEAVRIELVLQALRQWNYPVDLRAGGGCATADRQPAATAQPPRQTPAAGAVSVDDNLATPVTLSVGTSRRFSLSQPEKLGYFLFTPGAPGTYRISALSEPAHVDLGWAIFSDPGFGEMIVQCDTDEPSRGNESCLSSLRGGQTYYLFVQNLTGDQPGEPGEPVTFTLSIDLTDAVAATPQSGQGTVFIRYLGDAGNCRVNIAIRLEENDRLITPTGNFFSVEGLMLVDDYYSIVGNIQCPLWGTVCTATGEGEIELREGVTYDIAWSNAGIGLCAVALASMGE